MSIVILLAIKLLYATIIYVRDIFIVLKQLIIYIQSNQIVYVGLSSGLINQYYGIV